MPMTRRPGQGDSTLAAGSRSAVGSSTRATHWSTMSACFHRPTQHVRPHLKSRLAITLAVVLAAEACKQAALSTWRTYSNTTLGFEFRYPNHWSEANTIVDRAKVTWINFSASSRGAARNVLYVKIFPDRDAFAVEERLIAANATATRVTVDNTTQNLYGDFRDIPTVMISHGNLLLEIGDPSKEGYLTQILATFRFLK